MKKNFDNKKGVALVAAIMLIVFISVAVLGLSTFIVQWFQQLNADQINSKCLYLAQAGIHDAIYKVRSTYLIPATTHGSFTTGLTTVDAGETYRRGGTAADFLMVNTANAVFASNTLSGIRLQKSTSSALPVVTIASVNICWTKSSATARNVNRVTIGSTNYTVNLAPLVCPGGNLADISPDRTLANASFLAFAIRWSGAITLTDVQVQFNMTDGSSKVVDLWTLINSCQFVVNSTGKVAGSNIYRTLKATYDLLPTATSRIVDIDEVNNEITSP